MSALDSLLAQVEAATEEDCSGYPRLDMEIMCALVAPPGSTVEQSTVNGRWFIANGPREWDWQGWHRVNGWPLTSDLQAVADLVERLLPGWLWEVGSAGIAKLTPDISPVYEGEAATPALALVAALLRALIEREASHV